MGKKPDKADEAAVSFIFLFSSYTLMLVKISMQKEVVEIASIASIFHSNSDFKTQ